MTTQSDTSESRERHWLLRWNVDGAAVAARAAELEGRLLERRRDGLWRLGLPGDHWRGTDFAPEAFLELEPAVARVRRPLRPPVLPGAIGRGGQSLQVRVVDRLTGQPLPGVDAILYGRSGLTYRASSDPDGLARFEVLEDDFLKLELLPRASFWPAVLHAEPDPTARERSGEGGTRRKRSGKGKAGAGSAGGARTGLSMAGLSDVAGNPVEVSLAPLPGEMPPYSWGMARAMKIDQAHAAGYRGAGVRIAVLDTGVAPHLDLRISGGTNTADTEPAERWQDTHWHGTHVAGVMAAIGAPGSLVGVAPAADLFAVRVGKVLGTDQTGFANEMFETDLLEGIQWCLDNGIEVMNLSLYSRPTPALQEAIETAWQRGVIMVAPSGNLRGGGDDSSGVDFPACHERVFAVGAVGRIGTYPPDSYFQTAEQGARFSPRFRDYYVPGFSKSGRGLDFVAPGVAILSTVPASLVGFDPNDRRLTGYTTWMGTSQASPFIAGLAALILESRPDIRRLTDGRKVEAVRAVMIRASASLELDPFYQGAGLPLAPACVQQPVDPG